MSKSLTTAAVLVLIGSLSPAVFRLLSASGFGPAILALSFSRSSPLNTPSEYRFNDHGTVIGIRRDVYDGTISWAVGALIVQGLFWMPAMMLLATHYRKRTPLHWQDLAFGVTGVFIWLASEFSSFW
jgi:hypothetical protein